MLLKKVMANTLILTSSPSPNPSPYRDLINFIPLTHVSIGQLEARERLLTDMEEKAREKVDSAERESFRLKGLLMHMEHVAAGLRSQGSEEKERLRQVRLFCILLILPYSVDICPQYMPCRYTPSTFNLSTPSLASPFSTHRLFPPHPINAT